MLQNAFCREKSITLTFTGATDAFGFTVLPGGYFVGNAFWGVGYKGYFWSSDNLEKFYRNMDWNQAMIKKSPGDSVAAFSVRCIKDLVY